MERERKIERGERRGENKTKKIGKRMKYTKYDYDRPRN